MKKNVMMRVASALLVAVLLTTCAISGTFAKYVSSATGTDSARVAKWLVNVEGTSLAEDTFSFNLFNTINDSDGTTAEGDIAYTDGRIIAPGTSGSFVIDIENHSEVDAEYAIDFTLTNTANIPVEFSTDNAHWSKDINDIDIAAAGLEMESTPSVTVYWRWVFSTDDAGDKADTDLGLKGTDTLTVTAKVTATQVD